jgi:hypothetical protein
VFYPLQLKLKNMNIRMYYQKVYIIVYLMIIYGFQYFVDHYRLDLRVFNDVHVVLFYFLFHMLRIIIKK